MAAIQGQCAKTHLQSKAFLGDAGFAGARRAPVQHRGSLQVLFVTRTSQTFSVKRAALVGRLCHYGWRFAIMANTSAISLAL